MNRTGYIVIMLGIVFLSTCVEAREVKTRWGGDAEMIYDNGFMHKLMKHSRGGVSLFNMDLIQNDAPGAGMSDKGISSDIIWGKNRARKILFLDDRRAEKAFLLIIVKKYSTSLGAHPLRFSVNDNEEVAWDMSDYKSWRCFWTEFPVEWLKKGRNIIDLSCPEAATPEDGWELVLARADEYEHGGGDPSEAGETSFKSFNDA